MNSSAENSNILRLGHINGIYGVKGWVKIFSETVPRENILSYAPWLIAQPSKSWQTISIVDGRKQGKGVIAQLDGINDRDQAQLLLGAEIAIYRNQLADLAQDEYYWADLQGLQVRTVDGQDLGTVDYLFDTGANDVLVVKGERERLIPFIQGQTIKTIDLQTGFIEVDWDSEF